MVDADAGFGWGLCELLIMVVGESCSSTIRQSHPVLCSAPEPRSSDIRDVANSTVDQTREVEGHADQLFWVPNHAQQMNPRRGGSRGIPLLYPYSCPRITHDTPKRHSMQLVTSRPKIPWAS